MLAINLVLVFLPLSMGLDLDCCVPYPAPSPKKFHVFRGSGILSFVPLGSIVLYTGLVAVTTSLNTHEDWLATGKSGLKVVGSAECP